MKNHSATMRYTFLNFSPRFHTNIAFWRWKQVPHEESEAYKMRNSDILRGAIWTRKEFAHDAE